MESRDAITIHLDTIDQLVESCPPSPVRKRRLRGSGEVSGRTGHCCVYDETSNVIETHEHAGDFKAW